MRGPRGVRALRAPPASHICKSSISLAMSHANAGMLAGLSSEKPVPRRSNESERDPTYACKLVLHPCERKLRCCQSVGKTKNAPVEDSRYRQAPPPPASPCPGWHDPTVGVVGGATNR